MAKKKKSDPSAALRTLLAKPGSLDDVWDDLLGRATANPWERLQRAMSGINDYDDRSAVLVFGAMLDQHLEYAITAVVHSDARNTKKLFTYDDREGVGVLSSFAAKIKMAYALGIYGEEMFDDLELLKLIRNVFAHSQVPVHFLTEAVSEACSGIALATHLNTKGLQVGYKGKAHEVKLASAREKYSGSIAMMAHYLGLYRHLQLADPMIPVMYEKMYGKRVPLLQRSWPRDTYPS